MRALTAAVIGCEIVGAMAALVGVLWLVAGMVWLELADIAYEADI